MKWFGRTCGNPLAGAFANASIAAMQVRHVNNEHGVDMLVRTASPDTYRRADMPLVDRSLFDAALRILRPLGMIEFVGVLMVIRPIAMDAILPFKNQVVAWYGGSVRMPGDLASRPAAVVRIVLEQCRGYDKFDLGGAGWPDIPFGVRDYKAKFGGELVCYGRYRKVYHDGRWPSWNTCANLEACWSELF